MRSTSVVVPTVGGPRLERVQRSLARQTVEHEVTVVDDGSPARRPRGRDDRDASLLLIGQGTSEIQRMVIGKKVLARNKL
jgi:hypothetical protein